MTDISVEFHALREEVAHWLQSIVIEFSLHATIIRFPPYQAVEVTSQDVAQSVLDPSVLGVNLTRSPPYLPAMGSMQFLDQNPGALCIGLGKLSDKGLSESWIAARTTDMTTLALWRKIVRRLKAWTKTGAIVLNVENGSYGSVPYRRFSQGACDLEATGVALYQGNGAHIYKPSKQS